MFAKLLSVARSYFVPGVQRRRLVMTLVGVCTTGVAAGLLKQAAFGVDPYQCLCNGLNNVIPLSFGTLYMLFNLTTLVVVFFLNRHYIGIATVINMFLLGYIIDGTERLLMLLFPIPSLGVRIVYLLIGLFILCVAASLYFTADLGVSSYDAIALYLAERKIAPFRFLRIATDCICVAGGLLLGWKPGIGTIVLAFAIGPLISFFNERFSKPLLYGREQAEA